MRANEVYKRIESLCEQRKWSFYKLIQESGISESTLYNMMERKSIPRIDLIQNLCDGMNITLGEFFSDEQILELSDRDQELLGLTEKLDEKQYLRLTAYAQSMVDSNEQV